MQVTNRDTFKVASSATILDGLLEAVQDSLGSDVDGIAYQSVVVQLLPGWTGTVVFEVTNDPSSAANWVQKALVSSTASTQSATATGAGVWTGDIGARYFRVRSSTFTTGPVPVRLESSPDSQSWGVAQSVATAFNKAEDAAIASGDMGVLSLGQRGSATPSTTTSAAGDASTILVDDEGKQIPSGLGHPGTAWRANVAYTTTADVALKAAPAAGLKNYIKTLILENTGAAAARVLLKDVAATVLTATIPAGSTLVVPLDQPLANAAAATAFNVALGAAGTVTVTALGYLAV